MNEFSISVLKNYFQPFYHTRIESARTIDESLYLKIDIALTLFWFSVIDFYGGIYAVGKNNVISKTGGKKGDKKVTIATSSAFIGFIEAFFPKENEEHTLGEILYTIFRSGMVHQLSPKMSSIIWDPQSPSLMWVTINRSDFNNRTNKIVTLNMHRLKELTYNAYKEFKRQVECDEIIPYCKNIYENLIKNSDTFEDALRVQEQYERITNVQLKNAITRYIN